MSTDQIPESGETAAAREGADVEVTSADRSGGAPHVQLDQKTLQAAREALPGWDVQPDELVRTVTVPPEAAAALRASLEQVASDAGRLPEIAVSGEEITVRLRVAGAPPSALLGLAAALDGVFSGNPATRAAPAVLKPAAG